MILLIMHNFVHVPYSFLHAGMPSREELLIFALGLGGSGNNYDPINRPSRPGPVGPVVVPACVSCRPRITTVTVDNRRCPGSGSGRICSHIPGE